MKKYLIVSGFFYPENTPRAFRTYELVKYLDNNGYKIDLYIPDKFINRNIHKNLNLKNTNIIYYEAKYIKQYGENVTYKTNFRYNKVIKSIKKIINYFFLPKETILMKALYKELINNNNVYDKVISIGLPFSTIWAVGKYLKKIKYKTTSIADFGDPFYLNPNHNLSFYWKLIEKKILDKYNFIAIPVKSSEVYYRDYNIDLKLKVIPQGFNFKEILIEKYNKNSVPTFCYAGVFYENIRDPKYFFEYLCTLNLEFKFIIYTNDTTLFKDYLDKLGNKIEVRDIVDRKSLIKELSKMDFLVNFKNKNTGQLASKVVDYTLSKRPIFNVQNDIFNKEIFLEYLKYNYDSYEPNDISCYDINNVAKQFIDLK